MVVEGGDEVIPRRAVPLGAGCHVYVASGEVGRQRARPVLACPVEEGQ